jgi:hypothetical protein
LMFKKFILFGENFSLNSEATYWAESFKHFGVAYLIG